MLYTIIGTDIENSLELRMESRPEHLARLEQLKALGRLIIAGPFPAIDSEAPGPNGFSGSLIIAEFESLDEAQAWANQDPYLLKGVYASVAVKPFKQTLP